LVSSVITDPQLPQEAAGTDPVILHKDLADAKPGDEADAFCQIQIFSLKTETDF